MAFMKNPMLKMFKICMYSKKTKIRVANWNIPDDGTVHAEFRYSGKAGKKQRKSEKISCGKSRLSWFPT
jgi:hypothetical protein